MKNFQSSYPNNDRLIPNDQDPTIKMPFPPELIKDLVKRSKENGQSIEVEIARRIARSLEDVEILESDLENIQQKMAAKKPKPRAKNPLKTLKNKK
jgi:hypothetical protein